MFCLLLPVSHVPTTSFFHDFSGTSFTIDEQSLLGLGLNYGLTPSSAFHTDTIFGWKADFQTFARDVYRHDFFVQQQFPETHGWDSSRHGQSAPISALNVPSFYDPSVDCEEYSPTQGVPEYLQAVENALKDAVLHAPRPRRNLSKKHLDCLLRLLTRHDLIFILTDKNLGMACDTRASYIAHCLSSLDATHEVTELTDHACLRKMMRKFEMSLLPLLQDETAVTGIPEPLPSWMIEFLLESFQRMPTTGADYKLPKFYLLYKVHKDALGFRPITGNWCSPSQPVSRLLAFLLEPLVRHTSTYVRDADHLTVCLQQLQLGPHDVLVTYDVVNLYPSIPHDLCLDMIARHLRKVREESSFLEIGSVMADEFILTMLRLVLSLNYCTFMGRIYRQLVGYATGTACGGQVAHLYLEELLGPVCRLFADSILFHKRYIDDGFLIWRGAVTELNQFLQQLGSTNAAVRITHAASTASAIFLDLRLSRSPTGDLAFEVFQKQINRYLYPLWTSEIPRDTLAGIAIGEIIRYIKRCSSRKKFVSMINLLTDRLRARGWPDWFIRLAYSRAPAYSEREALLRRSVPSLNFSDLVANLGPQNPDLRAGRTFALCLQYSRSASNAFKFPKRYVDLLPPAFRQARFVTAWRKPTKLGDILRYRLNTVSSSPLAHANGSADSVRESVSSPDHGELSEGSGDDFFQATRFYTPSDSGRSSSSSSND
jgi:hypothetical protein